MLPVGRWIGRPSLESPDPASGHVEYAAPSLFLLRDQPQAPAHEFGFALSRRALQPREGGMLRLAEPDADVSLHAVAHGHRSC